MPDDGLVVVFVVALFVVVLHDPRDDHDIGQQKCLNPIRCVECKFIDPLLAERKKGIELISFHQLKKKNHTPCAGMAKLDFRRLHSQNERRFDRLLYYV